MYLFYAFQVLHSSILRHRISTEVFSIVELETERDAVYCRNMLDQFSFRKNVLHVTLVSHVNSFLTDNAE